MSRPTIIFNTYPGAYFERGGGEVQLDETRKALQSRGLSVELFNYWAPNRDIDILHNFTCIDGCDFVINGYKKLNKKIFISPILWPMGTDYDHWIKPKVTALFAASDKLFTNSKAESQLLSNFYETPIEKFHETRNAISSLYLSQGKPDLFRNKYDIKGDYVLTVANIDRRKNTLKLVEACARANVTLISIGHIKDVPYYEEIRWRFKEFDKFIHLGPISDISLLKSVYSGAKTFILPSMCETPGIAALEAASQGAKVIITEIGAAREYFQNYALYVNPESVDSIFDALTSSQTIDLTAARNHVVSNYTWEKTADDITSGYKSVFPY